MRRWLQAPRLMSKCSSTRRTTLPGGVHARVRCAFLWPHPGVEHAHIVGRHVVETWSDE